MEEWVAECYIKMRSHGIRWVDVAEKIGWTKPYLSMVINGKETPLSGQEKIVKAVEELCSNEQT